MRYRLIVLALFIAVAGFLVAPGRDALALAPPSISLVSPNTASTTGGATINVYGNGFQPGAYVSVGGVLATNVSYISASQLTAVTPPGAAGAAQVVVINPDGESAFFSGFSYVGTTAGVNNGGLWVAGISPPSGTAGQLVHVTGGAFDPNGTALFGGIPAGSYTWVHSGYVMLTAPAGGSGSVTITIQNSSGGTAVSPTQFTFTGTTGTTTGGLSISSVSPNSTSAGSSIAISGSGFVNGATVHLGGFLASNVVVVSPNLITAIAPTGPVGATTLLVTNPGGAATTFTGLSYDGIGTTNVGGQPSVGGVSPTIGSSAGGTTVSISGSGFVSPMIVTFGGIPATSVTVVNSNLITAVTPPNSVGVVSVLVSSPSGAVGGMNAGFTYELAWPRVTAISPSTGALAGGTTLTITGTGFSPGATVTINGVAAPTVSAVSPTQIVVTTPPGPSGNATILVTNPGGAISGLASAFAYSANPQATPPPAAAPATLSITGVSPSSGPSSGGTLVSIYGTEFQPGATVSIGGQSASATVVSPTQITTTVPAVSGTGSVTVSVTNPGGKNVSLPSAWTYTTGSTGPTTPPPSTGGSSSPVPAGGGLFVFGGGTNQQLLTASGCSAALAVFWTTNAQGVWIGYIPSVPVAVLNAAWTALFPNGIPAGTPIFARC